MFDPAAASKRIFVVFMSKFAFRTTLLCSAFLIAGCGDGAETKGLPAAEPIQPASEKPATSHNNERILFFEARVKNDPDDFIAHNRLSGEYLAQMRLTGDTTYLELARKAAQASLTVLPAEQNIGGLAALAAAEFSLHEFVAARDHARRLTELEPDRGYAYQVLGDALLELGQYDEARTVLSKMEELGGVQLMTEVAIEVRLSHHAALYGNTAKATRHMKKALDLVEQSGTKSETKAWVEWQLGRMAFGKGDYDAAEKYFNAALGTITDYFGALGSLGHLRAARGDLPGAISYLEKAVAMRPDPATIALLGDVYKMAGRETDAARQHELLEKIAVMSSQKGNIYGRELAMYYANHNVKLTEACEYSVKEYETRRDIYGADAVAWTCYKAGRLDEAKRAMNDALRLGTRDAQLFYHAGMIEKALGNNQEARSLIEKAIKLNPSFDLLQAEKARAALAELK